MELDVAQWLRADAPRLVPVVRPRYVCCWSKASDLDGGDYHFGSTAGLATYTAPVLPADLNEGYPDSFVRKPPANQGTSVSVEVVVQAAIHAATSLQPQQPAADPLAMLRDVSIVTFRNNLNKILGTPLNLRDGWVVDGCWSHPGVLYLNMVQRPEDEPRFPDADRFEYYGYKFEQLCSVAPAPAPAPAAPHNPGPCPEPVVDATSEFSALVRLGLGKHRILMAAEVDCSTSDQAVEEVQLERLRELKTFKLPEHKGQERTLKGSKWPRWWLQSFLAGVPVIVAGGRDAEGTLRRVEELPVAQLPSQAAAAGCQWDAWQMLRWGEDCLAWMLSVARRMPEQHIRFAYSPTGPAPRQRSGQAPAAPPPITAVCVQDGSLPALLKAVLAVPN
ncbi:hypothetical protein QJQ45_029370 [Haematococcus lacustris]|nr:hypothetical protein QJQ45_029370 [Haematococcus lacustris]